MWSLGVVLVATAVVLLRWRLSGERPAVFFGLGLAKLYACFWHRCTTNGPAPFPRQGPALLVSNHSCSPDPNFLLSGSPRLFGFLTAREHYAAHPLSRWLLDQLHCVPVRRDGRDGLAARVALRRLKEGHILCIFPEGNLSGVAHGRLRPGKHGAAFLALRSGVPVYPVHIAGGPRTHKLVEAWLCHSSRAARVTYGSAIDLSAYRGRRLDRRLLEEVTTLFMQSIEALDPHRLHKQRCLKNEE